MPERTVRGNSSVRVPFRWPLLVALLVALCCPALAATSASAASLPLTFNVIAQPTDSYSRVDGFVGDYCMVKDPATKKWGLMDSSGEVPGGFVYEANWAASENDDTQWSDYTIPDMWYSAGAGCYVVRNESYDETTKTTSSSEALVSKDGKYLVVPGKYLFVDDGGFFGVNTKKELVSNGLICAQDTATGKYGYIDTVGKKAIDFAYDSAGMFSNGYAVVGTKNADGAMEYEIIDTSGVMAVIPSSCSSLQVGSEDGMVAFEDATTQKAGYLKVADGKATVAVQPAYVYSSAWEFHEGLALVQTSAQNVSNEWSVIDESGDVRFSFTGNPEGDYADGYLAVNHYKRSDGTTGGVFLDKNGSVAIDRGFSSVEGFYGGYAWVKMASDGTVGFVDESGSLVNAGTYAYLGVGVMSKTGLAWARGTNGTYGVLDRTGREVIPCTYKGVSIWNNGIVRMTNADYTYDLFDSAGNRLTETSYQAILEPVDSDYCLFERDGKWGVGVLAEPVAPSAPQGLSATPGDGSLSLSWSAPAYERVWGQGALDTMASIVGEGFTETGGAVVLATGDGYWDALAASGVAGLEGAPVLLTSLDGTTLSAQTRSELGRLAPSRVYVCGGEMAVPDSVLSEVRSVTGVEPVRLWGQDATGTAVSIYREGEGRWSKTAIVATCQSFMDALSVAPYAYHSGSPILLARMSDDRLSDETLAAIRDGGFERVVIVGGSMAVSPDVEGQLASAGVSDVRRLWGQDCEDTSLAIARWEVAEGGMGVSRMGVATDGVEEFVRTGRGYWDSLCGAALCGRDASVLVIAREGRYAAVDGVLSGHASEVVTLRVFGGEAAVPASVLERALSYLG